MSSTPALVLGANGHLGKIVAADLAARNVPLVLFGHSSLPASSDGVKAVQGSLVADDPGLAEALKDVATVVHCVSNPLRTQEIDVGGTQALVDTIKKLYPSAESQPRIIYISIVGIEEHSDYFYYKAKVDAERIIISSGVPHTILRTAQWHPFIKVIADQFLGLKDPSADCYTVPTGVDLRPVSIEEVGGKVVELVLSGKAEGCLPDMVGPEFLSLEQAVTIYLKSRQSHAQLKLYDPVSPDYPDSMFRAFNGNARDPIDPKFFILGKQTWEEFLNDPNSRFW
ncbi:NAD(P)-binding protein [Basidiobolus meristosporus CBS 931.73]|uniref:NAD(P)-binding protein n=1 Tax=Basidiobolus meristosporus CBS 931.73 TaxID=1314790 RepID=A0A1Y1YNK6_9FUNG|nr:NAD(P)-binding protein [Basidiobolus meristosporus CBS 931.73]|eukprot:ORX99346.1 NAD(P)-binding protein [Basidiobolus meristosporus CBS 931.73]